MREARCYDLLFTTLLRILLLLMVCRIGSVGCGTMLGTKATKQQSVQNVFLVVDIVVDCGGGYLSGLSVSNHLDFRDSLCFWNESGSLVWVYCCLGDCDLFVGADRDGQREKTV